MKKLMILIFAAALLGCGMFEDTFNDNPCKSSMNNLLNFLEHRYLDKLGSLSFNPKGFCFKCEDFDSTQVQCQVVEVGIGFRRPGPSFDISQDSLVKEFGKILWNDSLNSEVDTFHIELREWREPNIDCYINYTLTRNDLRKNFKPVKLVKPNKTLRYKIISKSSGTQYTPSESRELLQLDALVEEDLDTTAISAIVREIRVNQEKQSVKFDELWVEIKIARPRCKLCTDKRYIYHIPRSPEPPTKSKF